MSDYKVHHIRMDIEVMAKNERQARRLIDDILNHAFIYGLGQTRYSGDNRTKEPRVFNYRGIGEGEE